MRLCETCGERPIWSEHHLCRQCIVCAEPRTVALNQRRRAETAARQRRGKPVRFDVQPYRSSNRDQTHALVLVPLPLLACRGDAMSRSEVAAVLGMTDWGVALLEKRALLRFAHHWRLMFGRLPTPER
jgi:hypothetical protein